MTMRPLILTAILVLASTTLPGQWASRSSPIQFDSWGLAELLGHRVGVRVVDWHQSGWIVWNGQKYVWVQESE